MYTEDKIAEFSNNIKSYLESNKEIYCYFNNDQAGYAAKNALELQQRLNFLIDH